MGADILLVQAVENTHSDWWYDDLTLICIGYYYYFIKSAPLFLDVLGWLKSTLHAGVQK